MEYVIAILLGTIASLVAAEIHITAPKLAFWITACAILRLPKDNRERAREEWFADINEWPGNLAKLSRALGFLIATLRISLRDTIVRYRHKIVLNIIFLLIYLLLFPAVRFPRLWIYSRASIRWIRQSIGTSNPESFHNFVETVSKERDKIIQMRDIIARVLILLAAIDWRALNSTRL
jgi:hypothetical protein